MGDRKNGIGPGLLDYDGAVYNIFEKAFDIIAVSFFFVIACIPVITAGAAFSALYYAVNTTIRRDRMTISSAFWHSFRQNFKDSVVIWLVVLAGIFIFLLNIGILDAKMFNNAGIGFMVFYGICFVAVLAMACYAFPALSRFHEPAGWIVKLSLFLMVRHLPTTFLLLLLLAGCYAGIFYMPYAALVLPGLLTYVASYFIEPILEKHMPEQEKEIA